MSRFPPSSPTAAPSRRLRSAASHRSSPGRSTPTPGPENARATLQGFARSGGKIDEWTSWRRAARRMVDSIGNRKHHHTGERITVAHVQGLLRAQGFRCAVTGRPLDPSYDGSPGAIAWKPSIDRIDSARGYASDNIRVVGYIVNVALGDWGVGPVIELAQLLSARGFEALRERDLDETLRPV